MVAIFSGKRLAPEPRVAFRDLACPTRRAAIRRPCADSASP